MKRLLTVLAAALLTIPVLSLNATSLVDSDKGSAINATHGVTGTCFVYYMGRWWLIPC